jgi:hypothetical protein
LTGFLAGSLRAGDTTALRRIQQFRPYHYFARPDADHLGVDSATPRSLAGASRGRCASRSSAGLHWRGAAGVDVITPGYEWATWVRSAAPTAWTWTGLSTCSSAQQVLRYWEIDGSARGEWNYDRQHIYNSLFLGSYLQHLNYWSGQPQRGRHLSSLDDRLTRGGPLAAGPATGFCSRGSTPTTRKALVGSAGVFYYQRDDAGGWDANGSLALTVKSSPRWNLSVGPYVRAAVLAGAVHRPRGRPAGGRNVRRALRVRRAGRRPSWRMETRFNYTFSPALSLEVYAQPFVTAGKFGAYKELAEPRSYDFRVYGRDVGTVTPATGGGVEIDPDADPGTANQFTVGQFFGQSNFNFRSLRGNAVLRWEWRPGSTLFLVWQQERADAADDVGDFRFGRDRRELFDARPDKQNGLTQSQRSHQRIGM